MLVYRSPERSIDTARHLTWLDGVLHALSDRRVVRHDEWVTLLIDTGELEAAVADAACPEVDDDLPLTRALREASVLCGAAVCRSWGGGATVGTEGTLARALRG